MACGLACPHRGCALKTNLGLRGLEHVGGLLFLGLFAVLVLQVVARLVFQQPLPWTDELAVVLYIWVIFWAAAFMVPANSHVAIDGVVTLLPTRWQAWARGLGHAVVGGLAAVSWPSAWDYWRFMQRESTAVLGWPMSWVFFPLLLMLTLLVWQSLWQVMRIWKRP